MLPPSGLLQVAKVFAVTFGEDTSLQGWIADRLEYVWLSDFVGRVVQRAQQAQSHHTAWP